MNIFIWCERCLWSPLWTVAAVLMVLVRYDAHAKMLKALLNLHFLAVDSDGEKTSVPLKSRIISSLFAALRLISQFWVSRFFYSAVLLDTILPTLVLSASKIILLVSFVGLQARM